jgi:hypothetical protein
MVTPAGMPIAITLRDTHGFWEHGPAAGVNGSRAQHITQMKSGKKLAIEVPGELAQAIERIMI